MLFPFFQHPLVKHIHSLIDHYGIDQYGKIIGTQYRFDINIEWPSSRLYDSSHTDIITWQNGYDIKYAGTKGLFKRANKIIKQWQKRIEDQTIQDRINSDVEKYLKSGSQLPEAMEDLKQINYHKDEIIKLSRKWQDKITNIHTT